MKKYREYIEREKIIDKLYENQRHLINWGTFSEGVISGISRAISIVKEMPSAHTVEMECNYWTHHFVGQKIILEHKQCGRVQTEYTPFCPQCGVKMNKCGIKNE